MDALDPQGGGTALEDEEMLEETMKRAGHELPQTQQWLRRKAANQSDDGSCVQLLYGVLDTNLFLMMQAKI